MNSEIQNVIAEVLERIKPREEDYRKLREIYEKVSALVSRCLSRLGKDFTVTLQGSVAKDTFLRGEVDIDVFVLFEPSQVDDTWFRSVFTEAMMSCFEEEGYKVILEYATHPYVTAFIEGVEVNIVPAFRVDDPGRILSAVDRTPFHTEYVLRKLTDMQRDHVRVLKLFLKAWGIYGAEVKVQGFSGYLAELLIAAYGNFENLLRAAIRWRPYRTCIDIEKHYPNERECLKKFRNSVLVVVDPVDPNRNAAAAVSLRSFTIFKLISHLFMLKPSVQFFEREECEAPRDALEFVKQRLRAVDSCLAYLVFRVTKPVPDVVWGQLRRVERALVNELKNLRSQVVYVDSWVDSLLTRAIVVVEVAECSKEYELHQGPLGLDLDNATRFLLKNSDAYAGPWLGLDNRLYCVRRKKYSVRDAVSLISKKFSELSALQLEQAGIGIPGDVVEEQSFTQWLYNFVFRKQFERAIRVLKSTWS